MFREAELSLIKWKDRTDRSPMLLRGARQIGKTFLVEKFAQAHFDSFLTINFEQQPEYGDFFNTSFDVIQIVRSIEMRARVSLKAGKALLFLDEIQECPRAIQALRYFKEQLPELHVVGAGSLLEFVLNEADFRLPVGRVEFLYLKPMSFKEFMLAVGQKSLCEFLNEVTLSDTIPAATHQTLLEWVKKYWVIGGMPAVVQSFINEQDYDRCSQLQAFLLQTYRDDFGKYATKTEYEHLQRIFRKLPGIVTQQFKYVSVDKELRAENIRHAIEKLEQAGLLNRVYGTSSAELPLMAYQNEKKFKLLFLDIGLLNRAEFIAPENLLMNHSQLVNLGAITEQFVGQELLLLPPNYENLTLHYWYRDKVGSQAEIDYLIAHHQQLVPIEVKANHGAHLKSLHLIMKEKNIPTGIRISQAPLALNNNILSLPFYLIGELIRLIPACHL